MKKNYILFTMIFALLGIGQAWANTASKSDGDLVACLTEDGRVKFDETHVTFYLRSIDNNNIEQEGSYNYIRLGSKLDGGVTKNFELNWAATGSGYSIAVSKVSMGLWCYGQYSAYFTIGAGETVNVKSGAATLVTPTFVEAKYENIPADSTRILMTASRDAGWLSGSQEFVVKYMTIEYTITPTGKPSVAEAAVTSIDVTVDSEDKQIVDLSQFFTMPEGVPSDFAFGYEVSGGVVEGDNFYATTAGEYTVKARIAAKSDCHEASALSDGAATITVNRLNQTLSWTSEATINTNMVVDGEQTINATSTSGRAVTYESNNTNVLTVDAEGNLKAIAEGDATITVSRAQDDQYNAAEPIKKAFKVHSKVTPHFVPVDFATLDSCAIVKNATATIELNYVSDGLDGDFTATPADKEIISVSRLDNVLTINALKVGTTTLTLNQKGNDDINAASKTYKVEVLRMQNTIKVNGATEYTLIVNPSHTLELVFSSNNDELEATSIVAEQLSGDDVAVLTDGVIYTNYREGEATWKVSQPQSASYEAAEITLTISVAKAEEEACDKLYLYNSGAGENEEGWQRGDFGEKSWEAPGTPKQIIFEAYTTELGDGWFETHAYITARQYYDGGWKNAGTKVEDSLTKEWGEFSRDLNANATKISFESGGKGDKYVRNVRVTTDKGYIYSKDLEFEVKPGATVTKEFDILYAIANGGDLKIECDNDNFTLDKYSVADVDCTSGSATIQVEYTAPGTEGDEEANIIIYNGVYRKDIKLTAQTRNDAPTAIDEAEEEVKATKIMRNGQIFIIREGKVYNMQGLRVE